MQDVINIIKDWPIIVQGAMGSGLFWLILILGEKGVPLLSKKYSTHSRKSRKNWIVNRATAISLIVSETNEDRIHCMTALTYRSSRFLFKGLMWLILGFILQSTIQPISIIGYLGCLYYLTKGYNVVKGTGESKEILEEELLSLYKELEELKNV